MARSLTLLCALFATLLALPAQAASADAVVRVTGCGPPALATFVSSWRSPALLAITSYDAVTGPDGEACAAPVLTLPQGRGRLLARVGARREIDNLAVLELLPDQPPPAPITTMVVADAVSYDVVMDGNRAVTVYSDIDDGGSVHSRLARMVDSDRSGIELRWVHPLTWPWLPGAPVVGDDGTLLGILAGPRGQRSSPRGTGGGIHAFLNLHYELRRPTPPRRYGIWLARPAGAEDLEAFWDLAHQLRRQLLWLGMDGSLWEIRDLGLSLDAPLEEIQRQAHILGGSVNAGLVVASTWDQGPGDTRRHRTALVQLPREPAIGERPPEADPAGRPRSAATLVLPSSPQSTRAAARAAAILAATDILTDHPDARSERSFQRTRARLAALQREHEGWRVAEAPGGDEAPRWGRAGSAFLAALDAELLLVMQASLGPGALGPRANPYALAERRLEQAAGELEAEEHACAWLAVHQRRAQAWLDLPEEQRPAQQLGRLIDASTAAIQRVPSQRCPEPWARLQASRGRLLLQRTSTEPEADLREAIAALDEATGVLSLVAHPLDWARAQLDLGTAWQGLPNADQAGALEAAIGAYRAGLSMLDPKLYPLAWATGQSNLGDALAENPVGDPFDNRREALVAYERALQVFDPAQHPVAWARTRNREGAALQGLPWQDPPAHLHRAIRAHQDALSVLGRDAHPTDWALTQAWLGNAVRQLPGDQAEERFQGALLGLQRALETLEEQGRMRDWAATQIMLGDAWRANPQGDRAANLEAAVAAYERALEVYSRKGDPERWAETWQRLGQTFREQRSGDRAENLGRSVEAFGFSLQVHSAAGNPIAWELCQGDLFIAQAWRYALEAETADPGSVQALLARGEAAMQEALLRQARRLPWSGEDLFAEAAEAFEGAHQAAPELVAPLDGLALAEWYLGHFDAAAQAQALVVERRPDDHQAARSLRLYRLRAAIAEREDDAGAWRELATFYDEEGDRVGALDAWFRAHQLAPRDVVALERVAALGLRTGRQEQAHQALRHALEHAPNNPGVLGVAVYLNTRVAMDLDAALALAERRMELAPGDPDARLDLAMLLMLHGHDRRALIALEALEADPRLKPGQRLRTAVLLMAVGRDPYEIAPALVAAYAALPPGASPDLAWALLAAHVAAGSSSRRTDEIFGILELLQQPRDEARLERLRSMLGQR